MREYTELEKLNAVAAAEAAEMESGAMRVPLTLMSVIFVGIAITTGPSSKESTAVLIMAVVAVVLTLMSYAGSRYAALLFLLLYCAGRTGEMIFHSRPLRRFDWVFVIFCFCLIAYVLFRLFRLICWVHIADSAGSAMEREQVGRWISTLRSPLSVDGMIQFNAGDFWSNGPATIRLLRQGNWIVVGYFYRKRLNKTPRLSVFDAQATPLLYSPEQRCIRIGKSVFKDVRFTPGSVHTAQELAQIVAAV